MSEDEPTTQGWTSHVDPELGRARQLEADGKLAEANVAGMLFIGHMLHRVVRKLDELNDRMVGFVSPEREYDGTEDDEGVSDEPEPGHRYAHYLDGQRSSDLTVLHEDYAFEESTGPAPSRYLVTFWTKVPPNTWFQGQQMVRCSDVADAIAWADDKMLDHISDGGFVQIDLVIEGPEPRLLRVTAQADPQMGD